MDQDIDNPCVDEEDGTCVRSALDRVFHRLDRLGAQTAETSVRLLLLGDSHIAADYIAKTSRARLQAVFGDGGRGYVHCDQREGYGGRRRSQHPGFTRRRMIDSGLGRGRYGISGHILESNKVGGALEYALEGDTKVTLYLDGRPDGAELSVRADSTAIGLARGMAEPIDTLASSFAIPPDAKLLRLVATGPGAGLFGLDFLNGEIGLNLDAVGPVGADATTYVEADAQSFESHVRTLEPALVMVMLGGNDALRIRKGQATLDETKERFDTLLERLSHGAPGADCLLFAPMDAGDRTAAGIKSKSGIGPMRDMLRDLAREHGCAYWDLYAVMGEEGAIARWSKAGIMNADLVHPRAKAGELIGHFFAEAFLRAYQKP